MSTRADTPRAALSTDGAGGPTGPMLGTLRVLGTLVAPTSLVVALLYYFGWARTSTQAFVMGLDESLFGYSAQDYILRSITSMFWPLFVAAAAILVGVLAHDRLVRRKDERLIGAVSMGTAVAGAIFLVFGLIGTLDERPSRFVSLGAPLSVTVGITLLAYATYLRQRGSSGRGRSAPAVPGLAWSLVTVLLLLSAFWTVSHYAAVKGIDFADRAVRELPTNPSVTIYSVSRLYLEHPVVEQALPAEEGAYRYRYTGLKLLFRADGKLFLRPSDLSDPRNIVIPEDLDIRVEYG